MYIRFDFLVTVCVIWQITTWSASGLKLSLSNVTTKSTALTPPSTSFIKSVASPNPTQTSRTNQISSVPIAAEITPKKIVNPNGTPDSPSLELIAQNLLRNPTANLEKQSLSTFLTNPSQNLPNFNSLSSLKDSVSTSPAIVSTPVTTISNDLDVLSSFSSNSADSCNSRQTATAMPKINNLNPVSAKAPQIQFPGNIQFTSLKFVPINPSVAISDVNTIDNLDITLANILNNPITSINKNVPAANLDSASFKTQLMNPSLSILPSNILPTSFDKPSTNPTSTKVPLNLLTNSNILPKVNPPLDLSLVQAPPLIVKSISDPIVSSPNLGPNAFNTAVNINNAINVPTINYKSIRTVPSEKLANTAPIVTVPEISQTDLKPRRLSDINVSTTTSNNPKTSVSNFEDTALNNVNPISDIDSVKILNNNLLLQQQINIISKDIPNNIIINSEPYQPNANVLQNAFPATQSLTKNLQSQIFPPIPTTNYNTNFEKITNTVQNNDNLNIDLDSDSLAAIFNQFRNPVTIQNNAYTVPKPNPITFNLNRPASVPTISNSLKALDPSPVQQLFKTKAIPQNNFSNPSPSYVPQNTCPSTKYALETEKKPIISSAKSVAASSKIDNTLQNTFRLPPTNIKPSFSNIINDPELVSSTNGITKPILSSSNISPYSINKTVPSLNVPVIDNTRLQNNLPFTSTASNVKPTPNIPVSPNPLIKNIPFVDSKYTEPSLDIDSATAVNINPFRNIKGLNKDEIVNIPLNAQKNVLNSAGSLESFLNINDVVNTKIYSDKTFNQLPSFVITSLPSPNIDSTKLSKLEKITSNTFIPQSIDSNFNGALSKPAINSLIPASVNTLPSINSSQRLLLSLGSKPLPQTPDISLQSVISEPKFTSNYPNIDQNFKNALYTPINNLLPQLSVQPSPSIKPSVPKFFSIPAVSTLPKVNAPKYALPQTINYINKSQNNLQVPQISKMLPTSEIAKPLNMLANEVIKRYFNLVTKKLSSKPLTTIPSSIAANPILSNDYQLVSQADLSQITVTPSIVSSPNYISNISPSPASFTSISATPAVISSNDLPSNTYTSTFSAPVVTSPTIVSNYISDNVPSNPILPPIETSMEFELTANPFPCLSSQNIIPTEFFLPEIVIPTCLPPVQYPFMPIPTYFPVLPSYPPSVPSFPPLLPQIFEATTSKAGCRDSKDLKQFLELLLLKELLNNECSDLGALETIMALLCI